MATGPSGAAVVGSCPPKAAVNVQISYDDFENFAAVANVDYELVPGFTITPEIVYVDNFADDLDDDADSLRRLPSLPAQLLISRTAETKQTTRGQQAASCFFVLGEGLMQPTRSSVDLENDGQKRGERT